MDDAEFEKYFNVYSDNKVLAARVLTSDVMKNLVGYCEKYGIEFEILFRNSDIYMRFYTGPMFEPSKFKNAMQKETLYFYYSTLIFILELTKSISKILEDVEV